ncbi:MAG TPA: ABC transporter ATP-binding protein [Vicinamibacteria bacterium]|jgi:putative ABC transport system ATP-binding protein|nr:ABC transporter ATP-binding protein [Vicinamibacteria bacterium]
MAASDPILKAVDLRMIYRVGKVEVDALRGVDVAIQRGEFAAIVGPSGCGKSTLLHILGGLARPTSGRVIVDGIEISAVGDAERTRIRREKIGFVFQRFNLFPTLTVRGNLELAHQIQGGSPPPRERVKQLLEMVGVPHKINMKPLDLSAGEQQRVAIARALVNEPAIVLADEPTGNLDSVNSRVILELFRELNSRLGQTIVMITHNADAAAVGHRVIEMKDGRVVSFGILPQLVTGAGT